MGAAGVARLQTLADEDGPLSAAHLLEGGRAVYGVLPKQNFGCPLWADPFVYRRFTV